MKITKYAIVASLITFFVGCVAVIAYFWAVQTNNVSEPLHVLVEAPKVETLPPFGEPIDGWKKQYEEIRNYKMKLLTIGEFHGDEVEAKSGEKWLGLFKENDKYFLRYTKIKVSRVRDDMVDDKFGPKTGKKVSVEEKNQPIFLLKNASTLKEREIPTLFQSNEDDYEKNGLKNASSRNFSFNSRNYTLKIVSKYSNSENLAPSSKLVLISDNTEQVLRLGGCADCSWYLYWVGDLDGDGKLDLFANITHHYNVSNPVLFLSSQAEKGKLVKDVAEFVSVGC